MKNGAKKHGLRSRIMIFTAIALFALALAFTPRTLIEFYYNGAFVPVVRIVKTVVFIAVPLFLAACLLHRSSIRDRSKQISLGIVWCFSLAVYVAILIFVLFGGGRRDYDYSAMRPNLVPLVSTVRAIKAGIATHDLSFLKDVALNILLFMPFAFLLSWKVKKHTVICILFLVVCILEVAQQLLAAGIFDIDDIFFNLAGAFLGMGTYRIVERIAGITPANRGCSP